MSDEGEADHDDLCSRVAESVYDETAEKSEDYVGVAVTGVKKVVKCGVMIKNVIEKIA